MEKLASILAEYVYRRNDPSTFSYETYKYCFLILLETALAVLTGGYIAVRLDMIAEAVVFLAVFFLLRSYGGGFHFKTFGGCYVGSACVMSGVLGMTKFWEITTPMTFMMLAISEAMIYFVRPMQDTDRMVEAEETVYYRKKLLQALAAVFILSIVLTVIGKTRYAQVVSITTAVVSTLVMIGKWNRE